jgi:hypothetical protein
MMNRFNNWLDARLRGRDKSFMEAAARNAALNALHYYVAIRSIDDWRKILDEAEKSKDTYISLADLVRKAGFHDKS